jgi:hypothetical protein
MEFIFRVNPNFRQRRSRVGSLLFGQRAAVTFERLRQQRVRIETMDRKITVIALGHQADNPSPASSTPPHCMFCQETLYGIEVKRCLDVPMCLSSSIMNCPNLAT